MNFCVTEVGLEEQLLAQVVGHERPDLQEQARSLVRQLGEYTITLKELEDNLLQRLANSQVSQAAANIDMCKALCQLVINTVYSYTKYPVILCNAKCNVYVLDQVCDESVCSVC